MSKVLFVQEQLDQHQEAGDECSDKRQVLFCPILWMWILN